MIYLDSKNVAIYPSANRKNGYNPEARLNTEENLTGILNHLTDKDSFVIDYDSSSGVIEFVLAGYYFKCNLSKIGSELFSHSVYAQIRLKSDLDSSSESSEEGKQYNNRRLVNYDTGSDNLDNKISDNKYEFVGLSITTTKPSSDADRPYIQLFTSFPTTIPEESKLKLTTTSIGDAGELEESIDTHFTTKGLQVNGNATITGDTSINGNTTIGQKLNVNKIESSGTLNINKTSGNDIKLLDAITFTVNSPYLFITTSSKGCFELTRGIYFPFNYSNSTQRGIIDYILLKLGTQFVSAGLTIVLEKEEEDSSQFNYIKTCLQSLSTTGVCSLRIGYKNKYFIYAQTVDNELWYCCPDTKTKTPVWTDLGKITALTSTTSQLNLNTTR